MSPNRAGHHLNWCTGVLFSTSTGTKYSIFMRQWSSPRFVGKNDMQFNLYHIISQCYIFVANSIGSIIGDIQGFDTVFTRTVVSDIKTRVAKQFQRGCDESNRFEDIVERSISSNRKQMLSRSFTDSTAQVKPLEPATWGDLGLEKLSQNYSPPQGHAGNMNS